VQRKDFKAMIEVERWLRSHPEAQVHDVHRVYPDAVDLRYCEAELDS
jgi:hypothetical protein